MGAPPKTKDHEADAALAPDEALRELLQRLCMAVDDLELVGRFVRKPIFTAMVEKAIERGVARSTSDHLRPASAADYADCSETFIYQMFEDRVINRYGGEGMPLASKREIDAAIREGRWCAKPKKKIR